MENLIKSFIALAGLFLFVSVQANDNSALFNSHNIENVYDSLSREQKVEFHEKLMKILERKTLTANFETEQFEVYTTSHFIQFLDAVISTAHASLDDPTIFCNFGGWVTGVNSGNCQYPWSRAVRNDSELDIFGDKYSHSCGGANLFRCNPLVFGAGEPEDEGKGFCVTTNDRDPNLSTSSCIEKFREDPEASEKMVDELKDDPKKLSQYLAIAVETIRSCKAQVDPFSYCDELISLMEGVSKMATQCAAQEELIMYLPNILTPLNQREIDQLTSGLGAKAIEYAQELERRQQEVQANNRRLLEEGIAKAVAEPVMQDTLNRARDNATKCLRNLCSGSSKRATRSIAKCAAYVKHAFFAYDSDPGESYANFPEYPWGRDADDAVESGNWLKKHGFVNILDYPELENLTPETAPVGAIIVYEKINSSRKTTVDGVRRGAPGHIEYKASENEYISDFINDEPTRVGGLRRPIGIYYKVPKETLDQLQEVPEL